MNKIFIKCKDYSTDYIESSLEKILKILPTPLIHLFLKGQLIYINEELENIDLIEGEDIISVLDKLSIKFEIFLFIYNSNINIDKAKKLTNKTLKHSKIMSMLNKDDNCNKSDILKELIDLSQV